MSQDHLPLPENLPSGANPGINAVYRDTKPLLERVAVGWDQATLILQFCRAVYWANWCAEKLDEEGVVAVSERGGLYVSPYQSALNMNNKEAREAGRALGIMLKPTNGRPSLAEQARRADPKNVVAGPSAFRRTKGGAL